MKKSRIFTAWRTSIFQIPSLVLAITLFVVFTSTKIASQKGEMVNDIQIEIDQSDNYFIENEDIESIFLKYVVDAQIEQTKQINLSDLEMLLEEEKHIKNADLHFDVFHKLNIRIEQHQPLLRLDVPKGKDVYLTQAGQFVPVSTKYTARVPVVTGYVDLRNEKQLQSLIELSNEIEQNQWLKSLTQQIFVNKNNAFELVPTIGDFQLVLGKEDFKNKCKKIKIFYEKIFPNQANNQPYKKVDLSFHNQIICS